MKEKKITLIPFFKKISADLMTPISLYENYVNDQVGFLLESKEHPKGRFSMIGRNPYKILSHKVTENSDDELFLNSIKRELEKYEVTNEFDFPFLGGAVGSIGYDLVRAFEKIPLKNLETINIPDSELMFFKEIILFDHFYSQIILVILGEEKDKEEILKRIDLLIEEIKIKKDIEGKEKHTIEPKKKVIGSISKEEFMENVKKAKEYIFDGDIFQVVLSQRWSTETEKDGFTLYRNLRQLNPSPYLFYFNFPGYQIIGSSPEMLVELRNEKVKTCPIAGTKKRGKNKEEDLKNENELRNDPKEIAEHYMLVDLGRNDMGKIAKIGSVNVTSLMEVSYYSHVMHLVSLIEGVKNKKEDMFSVLASFFPAGTLSGAPKIRAMEIIEELEKEKRGVYGGAIGYLGFDKNMDTCIAIRMMIKKGKKVYFQAGAGIVADSDPEKEYEETENKIKGMIKALD